MVKSNLSLIVSEFIQKLHSEDVKFTRQIQHLKAGGSSLKRKKIYAQIDHKIQRIIFHYKEYRKKDKIIQYLHALGYALAENIHV